MSNRELEYSQKSGLLQEGFLIQISNVYQNFVLKNENCAAVFNVKQYVVSV